MQFGNRVKVPPRAEAAKGRDGLDRQGFIPAMDRLNGHATRSRLQVQSHRLRRFQCNVGA